MCTIKVSQTDHLSPSVYLSTYLSERAWRHLVLLRHPLRHAPAVVDPVLGEALLARLEWDEGSGLAFGLGLGLGLGLGFGCGLAVGHLLGPKLEKKKVRP